MEEWKDIEGYEGLYQVSNKGRVKSLEKDVVKVINGKEIILHYKERLLKPSEHNCHLQVVLCNNGVRETKKVHKLVAEAFIPNPLNFVTIHHKNHNPKDNRVENLMWMDKYEHNTLHQSDRVEAVKKANSKRVDQIDKVTGEVIRQWYSAAEMAIELGYKRQNISRCCNGKRLSAYGFIWKLPKV